ncbi:MAG: hypothetical protein FJX46_00265 [Alphaproteobacteria bacterium]|nr:hypothetical protein [Alphaproteobacteria bacterium]
MTTPLAPVAGTNELPAKFKDPATGVANFEALVRSYLELERKLGRMTEIPGTDADDETRQRFHRALGVPERPEDYDCKCNHPLLWRDPAVEKKMFAAGFTPAQAQLVYDLAAEHMLPVFEEATASFHADRERQRAIDHFGGEEKWRELKRQLAQWGERHLPKEVFEALSTTHEGVMAMHQMMGSSEPGLVGRGRDPNPPADAAELDRMMQDPRYWRDRDPGYIARVSEGFKRLYPA